MSVCIGPFVFDPATGELRKDGQVERLRPRAARALAVLAARPGQLVSRDELHAEVWPDSTVEYDLGLNVCIRQIRIALGDDAEEPSYIETLPRRGYRLVAEVSRLRPLPAGHRARSPWLVGATAVVVLVGLLIRTITVSEPNRISMAVMPFRTIPSLDSLAYLEDGLTEELITALAAVNPEHLAVIGKVSSFQLATDGLDPMALGARLEVDYVLLGALRQVPSGFRVTAQLLDTSRGVYAWTDSYDLSSDEVLHLERFVAERVAIALSEQLDGRRVLLRDSLPNPGTRVAVLRARFLLARPTRAGALQAAGMLADAIALDSTHIDVFIEIARARLQLGEFAAAELALDRARDLDPTSARIDHIAGQLALYGRADPWAAARFLARSVARQPGTSDIRRTYANALVASGRAKEAVIHGARALALDPVSSVVRGDVGWVFYYAAQYADARRVCRSTLELRPSSAGARECVILSAAMENRLEEETSLIHSILLELGASVIDADRISGFIGDTGPEVLWRWLLGDPIRRRQLGPITEARVLALLGRAEEAGAVIIEAAADAASTLLFVPSDPLLQHVLSDPAVRRALKAAGVGRALI